MTKRKKLSKSQLGLKKRIVDAYSKPHGFLYVPSTWDKKLWKKTSADIYDYIDARFRNTLDTIEYYSAMVLLYKHVPNQELLVEFHDSPQWSEVARTYRIDQTKTLVGNEQKSARTNNTEGDDIEMPHTIKFEGEI